MFCLTYRTVKYVISILKFPFPSSIDTWAREIGDELWDLAQKMTKSLEIRKVWFIKIQ